MLRVRTALTALGIAAFLLQGCGTSAKSVTATVQMSKNELAAKLPDAAHPNHRGDQSGNLDGAILLINPLGEILGLDQIKLSMKYDKRFLVFQCNDGFIELEVKGDVAVNDVPGFLVGPVVER